MSSYKNYSENQVEHILKRALAEYPEVCKCEKCLNDMAALILNSVKPKYAVSETGGIYICALNEINKEEEVYILSKAIQAIETVSKNPKHQE